MAAKSAMTVDDALRLRYATDPQLSPDGSTVAYLVPEVDEKSREFRSNLWCVSVRGGPERQLTHDRQKLSEPRWSPDGRIIAFLAAWGEDTSPQVWLLPADGGEARYLTEVEGGLHGIDWAPDGKSILFLSRDPASPEEKSLEEDGGIRVAGRSERPDQVWVADVASGRCRRLTRGRATKAAARWSPEGRHIAFQEQKPPLARHWDQVGIWVMEASGRGKRRLCDGAGCATAPRWSPDGRHIAYLRRGRPGCARLDQLTVVDVRRKAIPVVLAPGLDRNMADHHWSADGKRLYGLVADRLQRHVYSVSVPGGRTRQLTRGVRALHGLQVAGKSMVFVSATPASPGELHLATAGTSVGEERVLTAMNPQLKGMALGRARAMRWRSPDGLEIEGVLILPAGYRRGRRMPLVVDAHGGPAGVRGYGFDPMTALLTGRGFAVLGPSFRGSSGYGRAFMTANQGDLGDSPFQDVMAGVDAAVDMGIADPERLAIIGDSYGGYMTSWAIGHTRRFKAAVAGSAVTNLWSFYGTSDIQWFTPHYQGGLPWAMPEVYADQSPMSYVGRVTTPTLVLHGDDDRHVPIEQGEQLYVSLRERGVSTEFVRYPREGHGSTAVREAAPPSPTRGRSTSSMGRLAPRGTWIETRVDGTHGTETAGDESC